MNIGDNVRRAREARNMKQVELARALGITQSMLAQIERGTKALTMNLALCVVSVLGCSLDELAGRQIKTKEEQENA